MPFRLIACFAMLPLWAANELSIAPAANMPTIVILGQTAVDLRAIPPGGLVSYDIYLENLDFAFAGGEFSLFYPSPVLRLSESQADWIANQGAVFEPGPGFAGGRALALPIDGSGQRAAPTAYDNALGQFRLGLVFLDPLERWAGAAGQTHPGGLLGTIHFQFAGLPSCTSRLEPVQVLLGPSFAPCYDYFSDADGARQALVATAPTDVFGVAGLSAYLGDPAKRIRADGNRDGARSFADALPSARCALFGAASADCPGWATASPAEFTQTFDANCDGAADFADALSLARLALGVRRCAVAAPPTAVTAEDQDSLAVHLPGETGALALHTLEHPGLSVAAVRLDEKAAETTWRLLWETTGETTRILLVKPGAADAAIPSVIVVYQGSGAYSLAPSTVQRANLAIANPSPTSGPLP